MDIVFPAVAFLTALALTLRSLGAGLAVVFAVGYLSGYVRANYLSVYSTFMFDAAVLGLYAGVATTRLADLRRAAATRTGLFLLWLVGWPTLLTMVPINHFLVQTVALRATIWYLPVLLIGMLMTRRDLDWLARAVGALNLIALAGGVFTYLNGIEALYPENAVTKTMYMSNDVADYKYHRVPSFFLNAHTYGGTMILSLPLLIDLLARPGGRVLDRVLAAAGVAAALAGLLMCAARVPVMQAVLSGVIFWAVSGFSARVGALITVMAASGLYMAVSNERFERAAELADMEAVSTRVSGSANWEFLELLTGYPLGAGMGSAVGTSIPYFLADVTPEKIGMENEYSRILVDQGLPGLIGWVVFVAWLLAVPPPFDLRRPWAVGRGLMYALCLVTWATSFIGNGTLASVPGSVMLLTYMGVLARLRVPAAPHRPVGRNR